MALSHLQQYLDDKVRRLGCTLITMYCYICLLLLNALFATMFVISSF